MKLLLLKTWRDMRAHWGQFAALILLVAIGITTYVAFVGGYRNLRVSEAETYGRLKFADFTVDVVGAPHSVVHKIEQLPGVAAVVGRLVVDTGMDVEPGVQGTVRIVGIPPERPDVNDVLVTSGRYLETSDLNAGLLHTAFAEDMGRAPGSVLRIRNGVEKQDIHIVGIAASPEYMFTTRAKGEMPSTTEFTVLFMPQHEVERLFGKPNTVTNVAVRVEDGADASDVMEEAEDVLEPYRVVATTLRADQPSNYELQGEIEQNRILASLMPALILIVSAASLGIALSRLVQSQRGQIGLAKALGYTNGQVLAHYLSFSVAVAIAGSVVGLAAGYLLSGLITSEYTDMLGIPYLTNRLYADVALSAVGISAAACVVAGLLPAWNSARIPPARAMRPDPNLSLKGGSMPLVERWFGRWLPANLVLRIPLRNVFRAKRRSLYTITGIAFAVLLTLGTAAFFDSVQYMIDHQFGVVENWDVSAFYSSNLTDGQVREVGRWDGVSRVQPALVIPVKFTANGVTHETVLTAMDPAADFHVFEISIGSGVSEALRGGGLILPSVLARKLDVGLGDLVAVKSPYREETLSLAVTSISEEGIAMPVYTSLGKGAELVGSARQTYNALYLDSDSRLASEVKERLFDMPGASQVLIRQTMFESLNEMMSFMYFFMAILMAFGFAMAFVVIYNTFTANVIERTREIATMRTIGEDGAHLAGMVTLENVLLALVGIPLGVWLGLIVAQYVLTQMSTEQFAMRIFVYPRTYVLVLIAAFLVLLISEIPPIRRILRLDLAEATKVME